MTSLQICSWYVIPWFVLEYATMQRQHYVLWTLLPQYSDVIEREGLWHVSASITIIPYILKYKFKFIYSQHI